MFYDTRSPRRYGSSTLTECLMVQLRAVVPIERTSFKTMNQEKSVFVIPSPFMELCSSSLDYPKRISIIKDAFSAACYLQFQSVNVAVH